MDYTIQEITRISGRKLNELKPFLKRNELSFDDGIEKTVIIKNEQEIIATGSIEHNIIKCVAVHDDYRGQGLMQEIITKLHYKLIEQGISHYFVFTKPKNQQMFEDMGFYTITQTDDVLFMENQKNGIQSYVNSLENKAISIEKDQKIGAIIANCNPFTRGHRFLMETASKECAILHIFILSEENKYFSAEQRYNMVVDGTKDLENVIIHKTSDYLISKATFPTYFIKEEFDADTINCELDFKIFIEYIVKALGINVRYVGHEPSCPVTSKYNELMKEYLPKFGVKVVEIQRKTTDDTPISATYVRKLMAELEKYIPDTTWKYMK